MLKKYKHDLCYLKEIKQEFITLINWNLKWKKN